MTSPSTRKIGFLVNPLAGIGGRLGFKGSDGAFAVKALMEGEEPVSPARGERFLRALVDMIKRTDLKLTIYTPPGPMGGDITSKVSASYSGIYISIEKCVSPRLWPTTAHDTIRCAKHLESKAELLVFVGGDGTARDILNAVDRRMPVLGVPSGVKVYSSVFAVNPEAAAKVVLSYLLGRASLEYRLVVDIDEDEFRRGRLVIRSFGKLLIPVTDGVVESIKSPSHGGGSDDIAAFFVDEIYRDCTLYILGPGSTTSRIAEALGVKKTLLGVDAIHNRKLVGSDLSEKEILSLVRSSREAIIVVSPIGGQGFIFGRGNQQISPAVLRTVGKKSILVVATRDKLESLKTLRVDTGDPEVDSWFRGYIRVLAGYGIWKTVRVE